MAATIQPVAGARQVQRFLWALGEARRRRLDTGGMRAMVDGGAATPVDPGPGPVGDATGTAIPDGPAHSDFFTEWQPPGPA